MRFISAATLSFLLLGCSSKSNSGKPQGGDQSLQEKSPSVSSPPTPRKEADAIGVDVWAKYKENKKQAEALYKHKRTEVTGTIAMVRKGQEFPPSWAIFLVRQGEKGDYHYLITVDGDVGEEMVKHAKVGHEMTVQGSVGTWDSDGLLYISGDKLIRVKKLLYSSHAPRGNPVRDALCPAATSQRLWTIARRGARERDQG